MKGESRLTVVSGWIDKHAYMSSELGGHGADASRAIDDDQRLLFFGLGEGHEVEVALEHLPRRKSDQRQRSSLGIGPPTGLAPGDARVDDGVLAIRTGATDHAREDDRIALLVQGRLASFDDDSRGVETENVVHLTVAVAELSQAIDRM